MGWTRVCAVDDVEEEDVIAFCAERLPGYKCPNKVWFVDDIPQGITGKTLRFALREAESH